MDAATTVLFATALLDVVRTLSNNGGYTDELLRLATRAVDMVDDARKMSIQPKGTAFCTVRLVSYGNKKIQCINVVREFTGLGLKESKELVESCPCSVMATTDEHVARQMYEELLALSYSPAYDNMPSEVKVEFHSELINPA